MASRKAVLMDTSFVIAIDNHDDPHHSRAEMILESLKASRRLMILHWGIMLELGDGYARLRRRQRGLKILELIQSRSEYRVVAFNMRLWREAVDLYRSRPDKEWCLTDCVSFALMEREGIKEALTADPHFRQAGFVPLLPDGESE